LKIGSLSFAHKKMTLAILEEIQQQIERYLHVLLVTGLLVGVATWLAFLWLGVNNAAVWGLVAGVLNGVPYLGPLLMVGAAALAGFLQFESVSMAAMIAGASLVHHHARRLRAATLAYRQGLPHECGGGVRRPVVVGLAVGRLGLPSGGAHPHGDQGDQRSRRAATAPG
jgi:hypothetical protein